jgi:excisionase family DNA binding protein
MADGVSTSKAARRLNTTPPTVRALLARGELTGLKIPRGDRFAWLIDESSIQRYLAQQSGQFTPQRGSSGSRIAALEREVAAFHAAIKAANSQDPDIDRVQRERDDLRATIMTLQDALARARTVADLQRQADTARAQIVEHLLAALAASEQADRLRRSAIAEIEEALAAASQAGHLGI